MRCYSILYSTQSCLPVRRAVLPVRMPQSFLRPSRVPRWCKVLSRSKRWRELPFPKACAADTPWSRIVPLTTERWYCLGPLVYLLRLAGPGGLLEEVRQLCQPLRDIYAKHYRQTRPTRKTRPRTRDRRQTSRCRFQLLKESTSTAHLLCLCMAWESGLTPRATLLGNSAAKKADQEVDVEGWVGAGMQTTRRFVTKESAREEACELRRVHRNASQFIEIARKLQQKASQLGL